MRPHAARAIRTHTKNKSSSNTIKRHQRGSNAIKCHQRGSNAIKRHQRGSNAIKCHQMQSNAIKGVQMPSEFIRLHQMPSKVIRKRHQNSSDPIRRPAPPATSPADPVSPTARESSPMKHEGNPAASRASDKLPTPSTLYSLSSKYVNFSANVLSTGAKLANNDFRASSPRWIYVEEAAVNGMEPKSTNCACQSVCTCLQVYIEAGDRINLVFLFINIYKSYYLSYKYRLIPIVFHVNVLFFRINIV